MSSAYAFRDDNVLQLYFLSVHDWVSCKIRYIFGRPFVKRFTLCYRSVVCLSVCLSCLSVLSVTFVHCDQTVGRIKMKLGIQIGLGPGHIVLDGDPAHPPQKGTAPTQFTVHICCGQMATWIKIPLGMELCLSPGDFVWDGDPALPSPKGGGAELIPSPIFGHFYCGQTAACIKMPLGMEVGLSPGDFVLDGDPAPPKFSAHVYYSYCDFVRTLHNAQSLLVCSSSSSSFSILCILFLEKKFYRTHSVPLCTGAPHSADSWSRCCELVAFQIVNFVMRRKVAKCADGWLWWVQ